MQVLLDSPCVRLVLSGHDHVGGYAQHGRIHFVTVEAMLEGMTNLLNAQSLSTILQIGLQNRSTWMLPGLSCHVAGYSCTAIGYAIAMRWVICHNLGLYASRTEPAKT